MLSGSFSFEVNVKSINVLFLVVFLLFCFFLNELDARVNVASFCTVDASTPHCVCVCSYVFRVRHRTTEILSGCRGVFHSMCISFGDKSHKIPNDKRLASRTRVRAPDILTPMNKPDEIVTNKRRKKNPDCSSMQPSSRLSEPLLPSRGHDVLLPVAEGQCLSFSGLKMKCRRWSMLWTRVCVNLHHVCVHCNKPVIKPCPCVLLFSGLIPNITHISHTHTPQVLLQSLSDISCYNIIIIISVSLMHQRKI